ncbi:E3 ubiquitin-protein ligase TRIM13 [Armadillidium vulgare]|nr:E3 ubiquitin-protein ligase TRIM13 [Armadillidium vulgare]
MEENLTCEICSSEYDVSNVIPKVLQCGHSFCLPCLTKIIQDTSICPKCRQSISGYADSFPTNYSILGIVESYKSIRNLECHLVCSIDIMKNKYLRRKDLLTNKRSEIGSSLEVIENGLAKLNELTDSDSAEIDTRKTKKILTKLEEDYKKSEDFVRFNYWKLRLSVSISLGSFENPEKYLTEIYKRLQNDEKIYGVHQIEDRVKYGKVSAYDNKLVFHSLALTEAPPKSHLIWFEELKQCINSKNFYTFLKISCNEKNVTHMVITEMFDRHSCNQFIKLCTGECGPSYKDSSYKMGCNNVGNYLQNVLHVEKYFRK